MNMKNYFNLLKSYNFGFLLISGINEIKRKLFTERIKGSYSQNYEDLIIDKLLNTSKGTYLEIGAYHPTRLSNTFYFHKKGWRGTVVEPNTEVKELFKKTRPEDKYIEAGISDKDGEMNYYQFLIPAINTFSKQDADKSIKKGHKLLCVSKIKLININNIVKNDIDFLSLDTEGFDEMILKSWPWNKIKPKVICVESNVKDLLKKQSYSLAAKTKDNLILTLKD